MAGRKYLPWRLEAVQLSIAQGLGPLEARDLQPSRTLLVYISQSKQAAFTALLVLCSGESCPYPSQKSFLCFA